jgi:hypothetical protein
MNAAVLCPGPSLASIDPGSIADYDLIVGVNRAPLIVESRKLFVDWWCFGDARIFLKCDLGYYPRVFASQRAVGDVCRAGRMDDLVRKYSVHEWESLAERYSPCLSWAEWTATAALICAASEGATSIGVYGADWTDAPDADGVQMPENDRSENRWRNEGATWDCVVKELGTMGVTIRRSNEAVVCGVLHAGV